MGRSTRGGGVSHIVRTGLMSGVLLALVSGAGAQSRVVQKWVERVDLAAGNSSAYAITADAQGNVYVAGSDCVTSNGSGTCTRNDLQIEKYSSSGTRLWGASLESGGNEALASAIAVDAAGNVYVTGAGETGVVESGNAKQTEFNTIKYNANGVRQWLAEYVTGTDGNTTSRGGSLLFGASPVGIAVDGQGNSYISGVNSPDGGNPSINTIKYSPAGQQLWIESQAGIPSGMALDSAGDVYVTGISVSGADVFGGGVTIKYNSSGTQLWAETLPQFNSNVAIALDGSGDAYVLGASRTSTTTDAVNVYVVKYSASGAVEFNTPYQTSSSTGNVPVAIAVDGQGNSYVTGYTVAISPNPGPPQVPNGFDTLKFGAAGAFDWERTINQGSNGAQAAALVVNGEGDVYVTGQVSPNYETVKYDTDGDKLWSITYSGPAAGANATAIAASGGNLYVTGDSTGTDGLSGWATIDYVQDAAVVTPTSVAFAAQAVGTTSAAQSVTLTNSDASEDLDISGIVVSGPFAETSNCSSVLAPGASCTIKVTFTPTGTGVQSGSVSVSDQWAGSPVVITLSGTGTN